MVELGAISSFWDSAAGSFDDEADHGLTDSGVRAAWADRLESWMPAPPARVLDVGCGTGSISLLLAELGHRPVGVDLSARMVEVALGKMRRHGRDVPLLVADAGDPPAEIGDGFDVVLARHLLWTLPDPQKALRCWTGLLRPGGRLVLIEGRWGAAAEPYVAGAPELLWDGGVTAEALVAAVRPLVRELRTEMLTDPGLWGRVVSDERYAVLAEI